MAERVENSEAGRRVNAASPSSSLLLPSRPMRQGRPLTALERERFEPAFGMDFSSVRIHHDADMASAWNARAVTTGNDVVLGEPVAVPAILAHELTHVVQQRQGGTTPSLAPGAAHEAEANAVSAAFAHGNGPVIVRIGTGIGLARERNFARLSTMTAEQLEQEHALVMSQHANSSPSGGDADYLLTIERQLQQLEREASSKPAAEQAADEQPAGPTPFEQRLSGDLAAEGFQPVVPPGETRATGYTQAKQGVTMLYGVDGRRIRTIGEIGVEAEDAPWDYALQARGGLAGLKAGGNILKGGAGLLTRGFKAVRAYAADRSAIRAVERETASRLATGFKGNAEKIARGAYNRLRTSLRNPGAKYNVEQPRTPSDWFDFVNRAVADAEQAAGKALTSEQGQLLRQRLFDELRRHGVKFAEELRVVGSSGGKTTISGQHWYR